LQIAGINDVHCAQNLTKCTFIVQVSLYNEILNGIVSHVFWRSQGSDVVSSLKKFGE